MVIYLGSSLPNARPWNANTLPAVVKYGKISLGCSLLTGSWNLGVTLLTNLLKCVEKYKNFHFSCGI